MNNKDRCEKYRNCPYCGEQIKYINIRSYNDAIKNNYKCINCRNNEGKYIYDCICGNTIIYKRKQDYDRAIQNNIKCKRCHQLNYIKRHKNRVLKSKSSWNKRNKQYYKNKKLNDIDYRIASNLRSRLLKALKENWKSGKTIELLGCSIKELRLHLENKFNENMNWNNYATYWEIDHIKKCSSFNLSNPKEQKICFNYTNLQPLEKSINRCKKT